MNRTNTPSSSTKTSTARGVIHGVGVRVVVEAVKRVAHHVIDQERNTSFRNQRMCPLSRASRVRTKVRMLTVQRIAKAA